MAVAATVTFAELYDALTVAGLDVGIRERGGRHAITVTDPDDGRRAICLAVEGSFDRTATMLVASMRLRESLTASGGMPDLRSADRECRGRWPEFIELWPVRRR